eukprot:TRINITY_DN7661_c0_g1_i1.p1 TRINITY_DN7661_c0_g1~~TRINITY_DN7661_c0_g1_i1.p1  ORF type:complete len:318 (-),score=47.85 TRINITY_DN7661_c0_g1_i1:26-979(-)
MKIFTGNANSDLAESIVKNLNIQLGRSVVSAFSNGETQVLLGESVRDSDCFIIQPTCNPNPNDNLMELLIMADAMKRASASRITAVVPCFGYARQDKKDQARAPITGKLVANMIEISGINRVITVDLHASQIQGFFDIPVDNLHAEPLCAKFIDSLAGDKVVVSPDAGGVKRAKSIADYLELDLAIIHKERRRANEVSQMILVGNVEGKICVLVDDMADTCGTLALAANTLIEHGAHEVYAVVTHGVLSGPALERLNNSQIKKLCVTNSIPQTENMLHCDRIKVMDISSMLSEAIRRTHNGESISALFSSNPHHNPI